MRTNALLTAVMSAIMVAATADLVRGQCSEWAEKTPASKPSVRGHAQMAYHPDNGVLLFGGVGPPGNTFLGDTWAWNGSSWIKLSQSGPSARGGHRIAYDAMRDEIVLFGGHDGAYRDDTWVWDGSNWTEKTGLTTKPGPRSWHGMAYDETRQVVVLFGGWNGGSYLGDTWEWNGATWTKVSQTGPSAREARALAFHPSNGIVLFGGGAGTPQNETWTWNGTVWTKLTGPGNQPTPDRYGSAMVYDALLQKIVLFGGNSQPELNDTWAWDGERWCMICANSDGSALDRRFGHAMAFDAARGKTVMFGGYINVTDRLDDTWEFPVSGSPTCIPTLSEWGMIAMAGLLVLAGAGVVAKRRSHEAT